MVTFLYIVCHHKPPCVKFLGKTPQPLPCSICYRIFLFVAAKILAVNITILSTKLHIREYYTISDYVVEDEYFLFGIFWLPGVFWSPGWLPKAVEYFIQLLTYYKYKAASVQVTKDLVTVYTML